MKQVVEMRQKNAGVLVALVAIAVLAFRAMRGSKDAGASLSGWSLSVSQGILTGNLVSRTFTASGSVANSGTLAGTYTVKLEVAGVVISARTGLIVAAGGSAPVTLSGATRVCRWKRIAW